MNFVLLFFLIISFLRQYFSSCNLLWDYMYLFSCFPNDDIIIWVFCISSIAYSNCCPVTSYYLYSCDCMIHSFWMSCCIDVCTMPYLILFRTLYWITCSFHFIFLITKPQFLLFSMYQYYYYSIFSTILSYYIGRLDIIWVIMSKSSKFTPNFVSFIQTFLSYSLNPLVLGDII